jgi:hypothetical protein
MFDQPVHSSNCDIDFFLFFAIYFISQDQNLLNMKETEMLQKIFEPALTKVRNYKLQHKWKKWWVNIVGFC